MRAAQRVAERAYLTTVTHIRPGVTEHQIAGWLAQYMLAGGAAELAFPPMVASGPNGGNVHNVATDRAVQPGEFVTMDFGCIVNGYVSDMTRTVAVGEPAGEMRRVYEVVLRAQNAGIRAARAGMEGRAIDEAARRVIEEAGYGAYFPHNFGHSLGVECHETPGARRSGVTPLPSGVILSAEPGIYLPGRFGVRIEDLIVLTPDGCEDLNETSRELIVLPA